MSKRPALATVSGEQLNAQDQDGRGPKRAKGNDVMEPEEPPKMVLTQTKWGPYLQIASKYRHLTSWSNDPDDLDISYNAESPKIVLEENGEAEAVHVVLSNQEDDFILHGLREGRHVWFIYNRISSWLGRFNNFDGDIEEFLRKSMMYLGTLDYEFVDFA